MNLCAYCLAAMFPSRVEFTGVVIMPDGSHARVNVENIHKLLDGGGRVRDEAGYALPMTAVSQFRGTLVCAQHAVDVERSRR